MSTISINYSALRSAVSSSSGLSSSMNGYSADLSSIVGKMNSVPGTDTNGYVSEATRAASAKIKALSTQAQEAKSFSKSLDTLLSNTKAADRRVMNSIHTISAGVIGKRSWTEKIGDFIYGTICVDIVNADAFTQYIGNMVKTVNSYAGRKLQQIENWFKYKAGKYVLNAVEVVVDTIASSRSLIGAVVTVAALAVGSAGVPVIALTLLVTSGALVIMTILDVNEKLKANKKALIKYKEGKYGEAEYYGNIDGISDKIDKSDLGDKTINNITHYVGKAYDYFKKGVKILNKVCNTVIGLGTVEFEKGRSVLNFSPENVKKNVMKELGVKKQCYSVDENGRHTSLFGNLSEYAIDVEAWKNKITKIGSDKWKSMNTWDKIGELFDESKNVIDLKKDSKSLYQEYKELIHSRNKAVGIKVNTNATETASTFLQKSQLKLYENANDLSHIYSPILQLAF